MAAVALVAALSWLALAAFALFAASVAFAVAVSALLWAAASADSAAFLNCSTSFLSVSYTHLSSFIPCISLYRKKLANLESRAFCKESK